MGRNRGETRWYELPPLDARATLSQPLDALALVHRNTLPSTRFRCWGDSCHHLASIVFGGRATLIVKLSTVLRSGPAADVATSTLQAPIEMKLSLPSASNRSACGRRRDRGSAGCRPHGFPDGCGHANHHVVRMGGRNAPPGNRLPVLEVAPAAVARTWKTAPASDASGSSRWSNQMPRPRTPRAIQLSLVRSPGVALGTRDWSRSGGRRDRARRPPPRWRKVPIQDEPTRLTAVGKQTQLAGANGMVDLGEEVGIFVVAPTPIANSPTDARLPRR